MAISKVGEQIETVAVVSGCIHFDSNEGDFIVTFGTLDGEHREGEIHLTFTLAALSRLHLQIAQEMQNANKLNHAAPATTSIN